MNHQEAAAVFSFAHHRTDLASPRGRFAGRRAKSCTLYLRSMNIGPAPGTVTSSPAPMSLVLADLEWGKRETHLRAGRPPWWQPIGRRWEQVSDAELAADRERLRTPADMVVRDAC
ncbi:hypothetical protein [Streptomyces sp. SID3343]|uniref:hypothetical protein n=1 Tax=Streptomyces sp. SID3343 TaxID=2690260 RepID=UPI00136E486D|nr:hypothetical protein [Streptomyces sp. SID3343]MYV97753.1 hypothetical protein [Streptomyces sp. SID3343]